MCPEFLFIFNAINAYSALLAFVHISRVPHAVNKFQVSYTYDSSAETKPSAMGRMQRRYFGAVIGGSSQVALWSGEAQRAESEG